MKDLLVAYFLIVVVVLVISGLIGGICWPYSVNTWLSWVDKEPAFGFWHGFGCGFVPVIGQLSIPAAVVTFIADLFIE